jgi:phosphate transport system protein
MILDEKINALKSRLIDYATLVEAMIDKSMKGILKKDRILLTEIIEQDEPKTNDFEIEIEEACTTFIAQYEPKAKDLRAILMILKINNDLERIGDHAGNIAESGLFLIERPEVKPLIDIPKMAENSTKMLKDSVDSFINEDALLAKSVCEHDSLVDRLLEQIIKELIAFMIQDPLTIERSIQLIRVARNFERIADLSTNICEDVIYMVEGRVIKHHKEETQ